MDSTEEGVLNIYTDGSSYSNPRKGGIGFRFVYIDENGNDATESSSLPGYSGATNNQMELQAIIESLEDCLSKRPKVDVSAFSRIEVYTDSMYVRDNYRRAIYEWPKTGWRLRDGAPVQNAELWKKLAGLIHKMYREKRLRVTINWVKGHKASTHNKAVDRLAKFSAKNATKRKLAISDVRRKLSAKSTVRGSVVPKGQRITVRIIEDKLLKLQRCYWYRYEVMSKGNEYYQNVDTATSLIPLQAGHSYSVRLNSDIKNPQFDKVFKEIKK